MSSWTTPSQRRSRLVSPPPSRYPAGTLVYRRGWAMVAMSVRMFLIAIAVLAVGAVAFLIVTA
jgi:hypothetical protein